MNKTKEVKESINCNYVSKTERLLTKTGIPDDFHWKSELEGKMENGFKFLGEIYNTDQDKYYSALGGKRYKAKHEEKHLDEGPFAGYRFAIHQLTEPGDWVFDPCVGSGTAMIEAINNGRNGIGIELEYPEICKKNIEHQESKMESIVIPGNATDTEKLLNEHVSKFKELSLIVTGTPYPIIGGGKSSDAPQRKAGDIDNYYHEDSFGLLKWGDNYRHFISKMYTDSIPFLKSGGYLVTIIKDPTSKKKAFMLQKHITEWILEDNPEMEEYGFFVHAHIPQTYFMRTYPKRYPEVQIPLYQCAIILKKK